MLIPMEILSLMMTRTDSGANARQRAGPRIPEGSEFDKILGQTLKHSQSELMEPRTTEPPPMTSPVQPAKPQESDDNSEICTAYAAGVMGNQTEVVFILEGDMESATEPEMRITATAPEAAPAAYDPAPGPAVTMERPEPATVDAKPVPEEEEVEVTKPVSARDADKAQDAAKNVERAGAATVETARPEQEPAKIEASNSGATGEVTARTPSIRTSERQGNEEKSSDFSGKGDLSPLENDNDTSPVKGQKGKTFSDTVAAVRNAAEGIQETVNNAPAPLAEGIRPERFKADQQMKQVSLSAPVKTENLFDEMVSRLESMKTDSQRVMTIQLKPEFLGKVALEIAMDAAGLHVKISAADSGVRALINGQITALVESLENKGIEVVEVEVAYTGVDNGAFKENREGQEQQDGRRRPNREANQADAVTYYTSLPMNTLEYYLEAGVSSVEYRA